MAVPDLWCNVNIVKHLHANHHSAPQATRLAIKVVYECYVIITCVSYSHKLTQERNYSLIHCQLPIDAGKYFRKPQPAAATPGWAGIQGTAVDTSV